ncbi:MAG TPA: DNA mismatch endonuclease Vsr [Thermoanaerobaculia bacterium]|nr:DNA mismatch endonuclease Vsr [Thermoanaerobaculia bacterium]
MSERGTPPASSAEARRRMQTTRQRDTAAEVLIRRRLHARGLRFRVDRRLLPESTRRADIVFASARVAVFIDGCFWHSCPIHRTSPRANRQWWADKLARNRRRDEDTTRRLQAAGWLVVRIWEHEAPAEAATRIARAVRGRLRRLFR